MSAQELWFLAFLALGAWVQSVAGFAMAMLGVALGAAFTNLSLPLITATTMLATLINIVGSLHGVRRHIDWRRWRQLVVLQIPGVWLGLQALHWLSAGAEVWLRVLLGGFVLCAGTAMMLRPLPRTQPSAAAAAVVTGGIGGVLNGLFGAGGPIAGWFLYRQPMSADQIRATLLAFFLVGTGMRTLTVGISGGIDADVMRLTAVALPATLLCTWLGRAYRPPLGERGTRRFAFTLLMVSGVLILIDAARTASGGHWP